MQISSVIHAVDVHACGEPGRVIVGGVAPVPGATMFDRMRWIETNADHIRRRMLNEPRGYPALCCNVLVPPTHPDAHAGFVIMEHEEYPGMSGSNTICVVTVLLETGILPMHEPVTELVLEAPAGLIRVRADCAAGKVTRVTFRNVPAFAVHLDASIEVPHLGTVRVDVAYGGMFYAIADATQFGLRLTPDEGRDIVRIGALVRAAANEQLPVAHPDQPGFTGITISQLAGPAHDPAHHGRNAVVVATGAVDFARPSTFTGAIDRSPCGTGTCARLATLHARGRLTRAQPFHHESVLGTVFTGEIVDECRVGDHDAIVPTLSGRGWITGFSQYVLDPTDPFPTGFRVGDLW
ncbi:MAG: proline racemase family protein [Gemmatimonadaceae bacterium]|nr:proline racemase family protein [Gemmatimonadaceae bacterium]